MTARWFHRMDARWFLNNSRVMFTFVSPRRARARPPRYDVHTLFARNPFSMLQLMTGGALAWSARARARDYILPREPRKISVRSWEMKTIRDSNVTCRYVAKAMEQFDDVIARKNIPAPLGTRARLFPFKHAVQTQHRAMPVAFRMHQVPRI